MRLAGFILHRHRRYYWLIGAVAASFILPPPSAHTQSPPPQAAYAVTARDMNSRTWTSTVTTTDPLTGVVGSMPHTYQELGNGVCFWGVPAGATEAAWIDSQDIITLTDSGAEATQGPLAGTFSADISTANPISLLPPPTASGPSQPLQFQPLGLFYYDEASGKVAQVGLIHSSQAELYKPNLLVYPGAIPGLADLMVVWTHSGCEQSLLIKAAPPPPDAFGLSPATTRVQYWVGITCPQPIEQRPVLLNSGLVDNILVFENYWMPVGAIFGVGKTPIPADGQSTQIHLVDPADPATLCLAKSLANIGGQTMLIEEVRYPDLLAQLKTLGLASASRGGGKAVEFAARADLLPPPRATEAPAGAVRVASAPYHVAGVVLDPTTLSGNTNSYTFTSGTTYYIPSTFSVGSGTATFQAGSNFKLASNAYLLVYGKVSFPSSGTKIQFSSRDDNGFGEVVGGSTSEPSYAALPALWMYYQTVKTTVRNASFRWAQQGIRYDENNGMGTDPQLNSSDFDNCSTGVYQNMPGSTLYLSSDTYCDVVTPLHTAAGSISGSIAHNCGTAATNLFVDASSVTNTEAEPAIAVNPTDPMNLFVAAKWEGPSAVFGTYSTNGGTNWSPWTSLPSSQNDPSVAFDSFGNLFVSSMTRTSTGTGVQVLLSTNKGQSFVTNAVFSNTFSSGYDRPTLATGPGTNGGASVWLTVHDYPNNNASSLVGAVNVTGLGAVGTWPSSLAVIPNTGSDSGSLGGYGWGYIAVGPTGQVAVVVINDVTTGPTPIRVAVNPYGLSQWNNFFSASNIVSSQVEFAQTIPASAKHGITATPRLAWDRTGGPYRGRLYLVYTDRSVTNTNDTDVYLTYSTNSGAAGSWTAPIMVNTTNNMSQFFPSVAVDQTSGKVAVSWYDCRDDTNNVATRFYMAVSCDGGQTFSSSLPLETGQSSITGPEARGVTTDYLDYTGLAFYGGCFYAAWADNSNTTDGLMDLYVAKVQY